jgi:hypothetical protein
VVASKSLYNNIYNHVDKMDITTFENRSLNIIRVEVFATYEPCKHGFGIFFSLK